jgi:1-acyl-sn-glycerol-3-phosphate acyltransferase
MRGCKIVLPDILQAVAWPFARLFFYIFARFTVDGRENLEGLPRGIIIAANHADELDPIVVRATLPWLGKYRPLFYVARQKNLYRWKGWRSFVYGDGFFRAWGAYPAYKGTQNYETSLQHFLDIARAGYPINIFPLGIHKGSLDEPHKVRGGVGYLALKTGAPVVPMTITGTLHTSWKSFFTAKHRIHVSVGKPLYYQQMRSPSVEQAKDCADNIWQHILSRHEEIERAQSSKVDV